MQFDEYFDLWVAGDKSDIVLKDRRFPLVTIVRDFKNGLEPQAISDQYFDLSLREVYASILYYLENTEDIEQRIRELDEDHEAGRAANLAAGLPTMDELKRRMAEKQQRISAASSS